MAFLYKNDNVLCPDLDYYFNVFTVFQFIQEIQALLKRFFIQSSRRLSFLLSGIIQPLLWLVLFGALFQKFSISTYFNTIYYIDFLSSGIIVFTAFTSALNAGLPIMFDREFGFFNRLLVAPMTSRFSIIVSSSLYIVCTTIVQISIMLCFISFKGSFFLNIKILPVFFIILIMLIVSITIFSTIMSFVLPGHIELLALILIINLPILFSSTALAPLEFMPKWLQIISSLNPLTYSIEAIRYIFLSSNYLFYIPIVQTAFGYLSLFQVLGYFLLLNILSILTANIFFYKKLE
uniref:ABC transporter n=1 Tax=Rhodochaete parvula TaxID=110510 RepID=A0A1X9PWE2_9RHOD|nr:ABC transporter [Rhodochaete parvula]ASK39665.1 ABC-2 type transporter [Rhodochaete parvula]